MSTKENINSHAEMVMVPLGGVGEIGMNCMMYGFGLPHNYKWIMVDLGLTFASPREPGIEVILPDLQFAENQKKNIEGLILTHAHEDHYGAIVDLWETFEIPVYATPFTAAMLKAKLANEGLEDIVPIKEISCRSKFELGPFNLELVDMAHSIPEPNGIIIKTPQTTLFHTGDWKLDPNPLIGPPTDQRRLEELGKEGVDVLVCDSTNAMREGRSISEFDVKETLKKLIVNAEKRVVVTTFASNVARIKSIAEAAFEAGRYVILAGRALDRVTTIAKETGFIPQDYSFLSDEDFQHLPPEETVVIATGSQGEGRAAMARIAEQSHPKIKLKPDDTVIFSSRTIPGNEKSVSYIQNKLSELGLTIITESDEAVHVTGHPRQDELKDLYQWLKPNMLVPVHGEERHLQAHKAFAHEQGIKTVLPLRNGTLASLTPNEPSIIDQVPTGRLYRDGYFILEDDEAIRERRRLSQLGTISVSLVINKQGALIDHTNWASCGIPLIDEEELSELIEKAITSVFKSTPQKRRKDKDMLREAIRRSIRSSIKEYWGKKPVCHIMVHQI